jgi:hypothetical protein
MRVEPALLVLVLAGALMARLQMAGHPTYVGSDGYALHETVGAWMAMSDPGWMWSYPSGASLGQPPLLPLLAVPVAWALDLFMDKDAAIRAALGAVTSAHVAILGVAVWAWARRRFGGTAALAAAGLATWTPALVQRTAWGFPSSLALGVAWGAVAVLAWEHSERWLATNEARGRSALWHWGKPGLALAVAALAWESHAIVLAAVGAAGLAVLAQPGQRSRRSALLAAVAVALATVAALPWTLSRDLGSAALGGLTAVVLAASVGIASRVDGVPRSILAVAALAGWIAAVAAVGPLRLALLVWSPMELDPRFSSTIAESQPPTLPSIVGEVGPWVLVAAIAGLVRVLTLFRTATGGLAWVAWAALAMAAALAHSRAGVVMVVPVAVLAGLGAAWPIQSFLASFDRSRLPNRSGWAAGAGASAVLVLLLVAGPTAAFGALAGSDGSLRSDRGPLEGAYYAERLDQVPLSCLGIDLYSCGRSSFGLYDDLEGSGWRETLAALAQRDTPLPPRDRPAVLAWWDYGSWIASAGDHPAVADSVGHSYRTVSHVLTSESEADAQGWILLLLLSADAQANGGRPSDAVGDLLAVHDEAWRTRAWAEGDRNDHSALMALLRDDSVFGLYGQVADATGHRISYLAVTDRMYPTMGGGGIFYAPVYLSGGNPDHYARTTFEAQFPADLSAWGWNAQPPAETGSLTGHAFQTGEPLKDEAAETYKGRVTRLLRLEYYHLVDGQWEHASDPRIVDEAGREYAFGGDGLVYPVGSAEAPSAAGYPQWETYATAPTAKFNTTMFARAYGGPSTEVEAGAGLSHWRVVHETHREGLRQVVLLEYVP